MKELRQQQHASGGIWHIGGKDGANNPYLGHTIKATWKKSWGGRPVGTEIQGELAATFCVNGRTLIGEIMVLTPSGKRKVSTPWSRSWLDVEILD